MNNVTPIVPGHGLLDGDGQHRPEEIRNFLMAAGTGPGELWVGTRMNDISEMPLVRRVVNWYMSRLISRLCGQTIPDTQCGFRMLHRNLIPSLLGGTGTARFDYETEMLILASRRGFASSQLK